MVRISRSLVIIFLLQFIAVGIGTGMNSENIHTIAFSQEKEKSEVWAKLGGRLRAGG
jgi:hypothetical protein